MWNTYQGWLVNCRPWTEMCPVVVIKIVSYVMYITEVIKCHYLLITAVCICYVFHKYNYTQHINLNHFPNGTISDMRQYRFIHLWRWLYLKTYLGQPLFWLTAFLLPSDSSNGPTLGDNLCWQTTWDWSLKTGSTVHSEQNVTTVYIRVT